MGLLQTCGWLLINEQRDYKSLLIDFDNILYAVSAKDPSGGDSALLVLRGETVIHVDLTLSQISEMMQEHRKNPERNFVTHPDFEADTDLVITTHDTKPRKAKGDK